MTSSNDDRALPSRGARRTFCVASVFGFLGVALGAFGAHGLRTFVEPALLETWETAARYQMYHALLLFGVALGHGRFSERYLLVAERLVSAGIVLFSGSLYLLVLTGYRPLGAVTPFGGAAFLAGWACLGLAAWNGKN